MQPSLEERTFKVSELWNSAISEFRQEFPLPYCSQASKLTRNSRIVEFCNFRITCVPGERLIR